MRQIGRFLENCNWYGEREQISKCIADKFKMLPWSKLTWLQKMGPFVPVQPKRGEEYTWTDGYRNFWSALEDKAHRGDKI